MIAIASINIVSIIVIFVGSLYKQIICFPAPTYMHPQLIMYDPTWYSSVNQDNHMVGFVNGDVNKDPANNALWFISFWFSVLVWVALFNRHYKLVSHIPLSLALSCVMLISFLKFNLPTTRNWFRGKPYSRGGLRFSVYKFARYGPQRHSLCESYKVWLCSAAINMAVIQKEQCIILLACHCYKYIQQTEPVPLKFMPVPPTKQLLPEYYKEDETVFTYATLNWGN